MQSNTFQSLADGAAAARVKGSIPESILLYKRALAQNPDWQEGWWYYGSLLYDSNEYAPAVVALRRLIKLDSKSGGAWALLGLSEYETGDFEQALRDLGQARALRSGGNESVEQIVDYHLAILLNASGQSDTALRILSSLVLQKVTSEDLQVALGLSLLRVPILPSQLDSSRDALVHQAGDAAAFIARKQYERAEATFKDLMEKYPKTSFLHYAYGGMLASEAADDKAEEQLKMETVINPGSALAYMEWSFLESKSAHYEEAIRLAEQAVQLSDKSFMAHYLLGSALLATGNASRAVVELETARRLAPESPEVRYSLSRAYAKLGKTALAKQEQKEFLRLEQQHAPKSAQNSQSISDKP